MTTQASNRPTSRTVEAFGGDPALLTWLPGGQGTSWRAGDVVLKPTTSSERIDWLAGVLGQVSDTDDFRVARHVAAADGRWVVDGWSATGWLEGSHLPGRWEEGMKVSAAFHAALARVHAEPPQGDDGPWSTGARVAWNEQQAARDLQPDVVSLLDELAPLLNQSWTGPSAQIIHGDLGNILYAEGLAPAVIDMSPHFAPAPFADAIIVADALAWESAPRDLAVHFARTRTAGPQLLARAVVYRVVTVAHLRRSKPEWVAAEVAAYRPVADVAMATG